jgi:hypothetical protein
LRFSLSQSLIVFRGTPISAPALGFRALALRFEFGSLPECAPIRLWRGRFSHFQHLRHAGQKTGLNPRKPYDCVPAHGQMYMNLKVL